MPVADRTETPSDDTLASTLTTLRNLHPTLGASKLHGELLASQPTWSVSEKRLRKVLQSSGLALSAPEMANATTLTDGDAVSNGVNGAGAAKKKPKKKGAGGGRVYPTSRIIPGLDPSAFSKKIEIQSMGARKGKGLCATQRIEEGEVLWREDPWVLAAEWEVYDLQKTGAACSHCSTPLQYVQGLPVFCYGATSASSVSSPTRCTARYCNRLCASRANTYHPVLCTSKNPAVGAALEYARRNEWIAFHALIMAVGRLICAWGESGNGKDGGRWEEEKGVWEGLAVIRMEERAKDPLMMAGTRSDPEMWKKGRELLKAAFAPEDEAARKKLAKVVKRPLTAEVEEMFFSERGVSEGLGKMNLNLEAHGGLYALHSHVNHDCTPNLSIRHLDQRNNLARITAIARRDIEVGEELSITYVDPTKGVRARRRELAAWGFGACDCERCVVDEKEMREKGTWNDGEEDGETMERELKSGLGLM